LTCNGVTRELSGYEEQTTNNRMELTGVIEGLSALRSPCKVTVFSDSAYVVNAFVNKWLVSWQRRGWRKADGSAVLNRDLWERLLAAAGTHEVRFTLVKGHADNAQNNRCDALATGEIARNRK
jgi:ribonuclease HI